MKRALNEDAGVVPLRSSSLSAADIPPIFDTMLIKELPPSPTLSRAFSFCSSVSSLERPNSLDGVSCDYPTGDDVTIKSKYQRKRLSQYYRSPSSSPSSSVTASILQEEVDNEEEFVHTSSSSNSASAKELFKRVGGLVLRENMDRRGVDSATATANATDLDDIEETVTIIQEEEEDNPIPASKINNNRYSSNSESNTTSVTLVNGSHKSSSVLLDAVGGEGGFCDETSDSDYYSVCSTSNCPSTTHATPSLQQQLPITCSPVAATGLTAVSTAALSTPSSSTCSSSSSLPSNPNHDAFQTQSKSSSPPTLSSSEKVKHKSLEAEFALALDELFVDVLSGPSLAGSTLSKKSSRVSFREVLGVNNEGNSNSNNSNSSNLSSVKEVAASPLSSPEINMEPSKSVAVSEPISSSFKAMAPLAVVKSAPLSLPSSSSTSITTKQMLVTSSKSDLAPTPPRNHQSSMKPSDPIIKVSIPLSKSPHDPSNQLPLSPPILAEYPRNASLNAASEKVKVTTTTASPTRVIDKKHQPSVTRQPIPEVVISHSSSAPSSASMPVQSITALSKNISVTSLSPGGGGGGVLNSPSSPTTPTPQSVAAAAAAAMTLAGATGVSKTVLTTCSNIAKVGAPTTNSTTATTFLLPQTIVPVKRVEKPAPILVPSASHRHHFSSSSPPSVSKLKTKFEKISSSNSSLSITPPITATKTKTSSSSSSTSLISSSKSLSASCSKRFPSVSPTATLPTFSAVKLKFEAAAIPPALSRSSSSSSSITKKQVQAGKPVLETAVSKAITTTSASKINNNTPALRRRLETGAKERPKSLCGSSVLVKSSNKRIAAAVASAPSSARKSLDERRRNVDINSPLQQIAKPGSSALRSCVATAAAAPSNKNFATQYKKSTGFGAVWR